MKSVLWLLIAICFTQIVSAQKAVNFSNPELTWICSEQNKRLVEIYKDEVAQKTFLHVPSLSAELAPTYRGDGPVPIRGARYDAIINKHTVSIAFGGGWLVSCALDGLHCKSGFMFIDGESQGSQVRCQLIERLQNLDRHSRMTKSCDYAVACDHAYPEDAFKKLICIGEGRDIIYGPEPLKIFDFVKKTCSELSDPESAQACIEESGCGQPFAPTLTDTDPYEGAQCSPQRSDSFCSGNYVGDTCQSMSGNGICRSTGVTGPGGLPGCRCQIR